jgi:hypothetical protein
MVPKRRFIFGGHALGLGAHIRRPNDFVLPVQAASCIPVTGGISEGRAVGKDVKGFRDVVFDLATSSIKGDFIDLSQAREITLGQRPADSVPIRTSANAYVRGLRVVNIFRVAAIRAGMIADTDGKGEASFHLVNTSLERVQVGHSVLKVGLLMDFFNQHDTMKSLQEGFPKLPDSHKESFFSTGPSEGAHPATLPESGAVIFATIVEKLEWQGEPYPGATIQGNALTIPDFGTAFFGELLIAEYSRRLTMIRFQLGSEKGGGSSAAEIEVVGSTWP